MHTSTIFEGAWGRLCSSKGGACATAQWHNGQSKPATNKRTPSYWSWVSILGWGR